MQLRIVLAVFVGLEEEEEIEEEEGEIWITYKDEADFINNWVCPGGLCIDCIGR